MTFLYYLKGVDRTNITLAPIPEDVINALVSEGQYLNCAGGLMIEHPLLAPYIVNIEGEIESVMGFSPSLFTRLMRNLIDNKKLWRDSIVINS